MQNSVRWRADTIYIKSGKYFIPRVYVWGEYSFQAVYKGKAKE